MFEQNNVGVRLSNPVGRDVVNLLKTVASSPDTAELSSKLESLEDATKIIIENMDGKWISYGFL